MRSFLRHVIENPLATTLAVLVMVFAGAYRAVHMPVDLFPALDVPVVNIITHYPGAAPEDMELLITRPVEDEMRSIPGIRRVASISAQGISRVTVQFGWKTGVREARQLVQARLARLAGKMPSGVSPGLENIGTTLQEVSGYIIYGGGDPVTLRNTAIRAIAGRLMAVDGVSFVDVLGGDRRAFNVKVRPGELARLHISLGDIVRILKENNVTAVSGYLERSSREYLIRGDARLKTLKDIRSLTVAGGGTAPVLLGSIASVYEGRVPRHYVVHGDGVPAVALVVHKQPGASTIGVVREVDRLMDELRPMLPARSTVKKFYDQSEIIAEARGEIFRDLVIGALLAVLVLYFFLGSLWPTLVVALTMPVTLLATMAVMGLIGLGLNVITMTALALAVGMIVDDAIVVAENIYRRKAPDAARRAIEGAAEIAGPDASGTFTTVAAFIPLVLVTGLAARFLRPFGLTLSAALLVSLILSLTLVPMLAAIGRTGQTGRHFPGGAVLSVAERGLTSVLRFCFRRKAPVLILAAAFLLLSALSAFLGKVTVLPPIDEGALLIEYVMPPGTSLTESNRIGGTLERIALADPDVSAVYRRTGSPERGYQVEGVNMGEMLIKLKGRGERRRSVKEIMASFRKAYSRFKGVVFLYHQPTQEKIDESFSGLPALFGITIYGPDMKRLIKLAGRVEGLVLEDPAVREVVNNTKVKASKIDVRLDSAGLARHGVSAGEVLTTLRASRFGIEATNIIRQKEDVAVLVRLDADETTDPDTLGRLPVVTEKGGLVPLSRVSKITVGHAPAVITRLNGQREITLIVETEAGIASLVSRLRDRLRSLKLPSGYSIDFTGQYRTLMTTALELAFTIFAAVVLIYLIMAMQFRTFIQPLIILLTIPFSLVGALVALFTTGQGVDVSVGMGAVTLAGIAVNNAIVLVDYANRRRTSGEAVEEAILGAASIRLRPILLTSLTTIFALLPVAIGGAADTSLFQPFAITVIGGLLSGAFATLVIVPTLTALLIK